MCHPITSYKNLSKQITESPIGRSVASSWVSWGEPWFRGLSSNTLVAPWSWTPLVLSMDAFPKTRKGSVLILFNCCLHSSFRSHAIRWALQWNKREGPGHAQKPSRVKLLDGKQQKQHRCCMPRSHCLEVYKYLQISRCKYVQMLLCPLNPCWTLQSNYIKIFLSKEGFALNMISLCTEL